MTTQLPIPSFFDPANAGKWSFTPDLTELANTAQDWRQANSIKPAASDSRKIELLLIDVQKDFCLPEGTLFVGGRSGTGAIDDNVRLSEFIYKNLNFISSVTTTLDTHFAYQIFFPWFWQDANGQMPPAHTVISTEDIQNGTYVPNPGVAGLLVGGQYQMLLRQVEYYTRELEAAGKYQLYLWPPHCLLGSDGYALSGVIQEARSFHAFTRFSQTMSEIKGSYPLTENYSVLRPEVLTQYDGKPMAQKNTQFLESLLTNDYLIIAGQAASHCVSSSIDDLLSEIVAQDPALAQKVYILEDAMSSVTVPDGQGGFVADFTPEAEAALQRFKTAGMNVVKTTDPIDQWSGIEL